MERIFANLYRLGGAPDKRGTSHTYLLVRKEGNLLVCNRSGPSARDIAEIERLGGIDSQWISHHHDANRDGLHEDLCARFGCKLHHHSADRSGVRQKTKCPYVQFGDEGLEHGSDFEALFFPTCSAGHTVYRWRHRGKYFLFTSHALYTRENKWNLQFNPHRVTLWRSQLSKLAKLRVDYVFPGYTAQGEDGFYRLNDQMRKSLSSALRAKFKEAAPS